MSSERTIMRQDRDMALNWAWSVLPSSIRGDDRAGRGGLAHGGTAKVFTLRHRSSTIPGIDGRGSHGATVVWLSR